MIETEDFTIVYTGEEAKNLYKLMRRTGLNLDSYIMDELYESFRKEAFCIWNEDYRTREYCADCYHADVCEDAISGEGE